VGGESSLDTSAAIATIVGATSGTVIAVVGVLVTCLACCCSYQRAPRKLYLTMQNECRHNLRIQNSCTSFPDARIVARNINANEAANFELQIPWEIFRDGLTAVTCGCLPFRRPKNLRIALLCSLQEVSDEGRASAPPPTIRYFLLGISATSGKSMLCFLQAKTEADAEDLRARMIVGDSNGVFGRMRGQWQRVDRTGRITLDDAVVQTSGPTSRELLVVLSTSAHRVGRGRGSVGTSMLSATAIPAVASGRARTSSTSPSQLPRAEAFRTGGVAAAGASGAFSHIEPPVITFDSSSSDTAVTRHRIDR
jgi:hypothetical protein